MKPAPKTLFRNEVVRISYMSRRNRLYAEMREQMAKTTNATKDMAMEPFAMLGKESLPQFSIKSLARAVADDDDDIRRYASTMSVGAHPRRPAAVRMGRVANWSKKINPKNLNRSGSSHSRCTQCLSCSEIAICLLLLTP